MSTEKVSLTLDEALVSAARAQVGRRGLSQYVNQALLRQLQHDRMAKLLAEFESEVGSIDSKIMEDVRREWPDLAEILPRQTG